MVPKSTNSSSIRSAKVNFWETVIGQSLYIFLPMTRSQTWEDTDKGSQRVFGLTQNFTAIWGVTK